MTMLFPKFKGGHGVQMFDCLMLMIPGGRIAYNGPLGLGVVSLIRFFYGIPGIAPYTLDSNPATWALNCTSREEEQRLHMSFSAHYLASASFRCLPLQLGCHKRPCTRHSSAGDKRLLSFSLSLIQSCIGNPTNHH